MRPDRERSERREAGNPPPPPPRGYHPDPDAKDRHTAHISEVEAHAAHKHLNRAMAALCGPRAGVRYAGVAIREVRAAMDVLKMEEK